MTYPYLELRLLVNFLRCIGEAIKPLLAEFGRVDDWMPGGFKVAAGMLIFGGVTAQHLATVLTNAQVHPLTIHFDAFFTPKNRIVRLVNHVL